MFQRPRPQDERMATINSPWVIVTASAASYTALFVGTQKLFRSTSDRRTNLKAISSLHATVTTGLALYALSKSWLVERPLAPLHLGLGNSNFNDSTNPMIAGRSALGNALTGWETGYLFFDTVALVYIAHWNLATKNGKVSLLGATYDLARRDPLTLFHHISLLAGLGTLQRFIASDRERGVYIILTFMLMNASTPLLHLRWWRRERTGRSSLALDTALAVVFGVARLGSVVWVLREYGRWHGVGVSEASRGQRWICQLGTGALVGLNGVWLGMLGRSIWRRVLEIARR